MKQSDPATLAKLLPDEESFRAAEAAIDALAALRFGHRKWRHPRDLVRIDIRMHDGDYSQATMIAVAEPGEWFLREFNMLCMGFNGKLTVETRRGWPIASRVREEGEQ